MLYKTFWVHPVCHIICLLVHFQSLVCLCISVIIHISWSFNCYAWGHTQFMPMFVDKRSIHPLIILLRDCVFPLHWRGIHTWIKWQNHVYDAFSKFSTLLIRQIPVSHVFLRAESGGMLGFSWKSILFETCPFYWFVMLQITLLPLQWWLMTGN